MAVFEINFLSLGAGMIGICPMPGRFSLYENDLKNIINWCPSLVLTMTSLSELQTAGASTLGDDLQAGGIDWIHFPVADYGIPTAEQSEHWQALGVQVERWLSGGGRVLAHCYGGCGRSGMALMRLMCEAGEPADEALWRLRTVRPCAVETEDQRGWASQGI
ncbi:MAG: protein phosphatase [Paracoccaceae bacterium]|nr:protein phosphatase [Paracoccaceae bacterium]